MTIILNSLLTILEATYQLTPGCHGGGLPFNINYK
jgi:hypothetical protein